MADSLAAMGTDQRVALAADARLLLHAQFAADPVSLSALANLGRDQWLAKQFTSPRGQSGMDWLDTQGHNAVTSEARYFWPMAGDHMIWNQILAQPDQMRQRCAFALSQFFVVSLNPIDGFWPPYIMAGYWDVLLKGAFGNFRDLLEAVTLNAGMGMYLNTKGNLKEDESSGRRPDENYAREIMQLFTIGLHELNPDGTEKLGADGKPVETYGQDDITNLSRVFTGYDHDYRRVKRTRVAWQDYPVVSTEFCIDPMVLDPANHSTLAVSFLGCDIAADTPGEAALKTALDHLFAHPNVGPFFGKQMIQRMVSSNPSPAYVKRVADAFADNGSGVRGDMRAVWKAILTDPEALAAPEPEAVLSGRLREPVTRWVGWFRTVGLTSENGKFEIYDTSGAGEGLGQSPLRSPSVFNFYRPGYVPPQTAMAERDLPAPEFQLQNESSAAGYINFLQWTLRAGYDDVKPTYEALLPVAHDASAVVDWLNLHLAADQLSAPTTTLITEALTSKGVTAESSRSDKLDLLASACLLVMSAPEYLVLK